ncbi:hypothetical protein HC891_06590 [Candidatus Gracilibacteria bacterium]|nr:hypothetical protein [Candidatus Gracilibacteria bacterium]
MLRPYDMITSPVYTTSHALDGTRLIWLRSSFQRASVAPLINQLLALSATIIP